MKKYLVKEVSKATEINDLHKGETHVYFVGKGDILVAAYGTNSFIDRYAWISDIVEYGYSRKCDAARNWTYKNPENSEFWESDVEIVEYDTRDLIIRSGYNDVRVDLLNV